MLVAAVSSYLVGSFPTAHLLGKWLRRVDIRRVGVRNMGALNAYRVLGPFWGVITFLVDAGKGAFAVVMAQAQGLGVHSMALCGMLAVAGHNWPVFARFRGGKGAATGIGVVFALGGNVVLWTIGLIGLLYLLTRNVSFALGVTFVSLPGLYLHEGRAAEALTMALGVIVLIGIKMRPSIKDLQYASQGRVVLVFKYLAFGVPADKVAERRGWSAVGAGEDLVKPEERE